MYKFKKILEQVTLTRNLNEYYLKNKKILELSIIKCCTVSTLLYYFLHGSNMNIFMQLFVFNTKQLIKL